MLEKVLRFACDGDSVFLAEGSYPANGLYDFQGRLHIEGLAADRAVVIENGECDDFFVHVGGSETTRLSLTNITLKQQGGVEGSVCIGCGEALLESCTVIHCYWRGHSCMPEWKVSDARLQSQWSVGGRGEGGEGRNSPHRAQ
jgi:hypothetical protein